MNAQGQRAALLGAGVFAALVLVTGCSDASGPAESSPAPDAAVVLPGDLNADDIGDGGLDPASVRLAAESETYRVWTARDRAENTCVVSAAEPEGTRAAACGDDEHFAERGISSSLLVGSAGNGDLSPVWLQAFLLPEGAPAHVVAEQIPDSQTYGQLVVRYGSLPQFESQTIRVPGVDGDIELQLYGRDNS